MVTPLATSLFQLYKLFKNMVCILALVGLALVLAIFQNIGQFFSKSSGHPVENPLAGKRPQKFGKK
jgi:hypothetical protein